jgi:hypothetical protein
LISDFVSGLLQENNERNMPNAKSIKLAFCFIEIPSSCSPSSQAARKRRHPRGHGAAFGRNQKKTTTEAQSSQRKAKASFGVNLLWVRH